MPASDRYFPPPWKVDDLAACFVVKDSIGQELVYIYYQEAPSRRAVAKLLTRDEARWIALGIAKLPELIRRRTPNLSFGSMPFWATLISCAQTAKPPTYDAPDIAKLPELLRRD